MDTETTAPPEMTPQQIAAREEGMTRLGEPTTQVVQDDYFGFEETFKVYLPDGISFVEHRSLNEGAKRKYLNSVNREVRLHRATQDASIKTAPGDERKALLESAITGWNLKRGGEPIPFSTRALAEFLDKANPKIVDIIEKDVRLHNPWLLAEMTVEDIDREIADLQDMRDRIVAEEEGKATSASQ